MSSASAASASFCAVWAARCSSRRDRSAAMAAPACSTRPVNRPASASISPSTHAVGNVSASAEALALILRASPVPAASRSSIKVTSVLRSSNRRPKWANAASGSPACHEPMMRSPAVLISQTVPSASTRPNRCGSLRGGAVTWCGVGRAVGRGPGRGPGRGTGTETGGAESSIWGSSAVMRSSPTLCTSARPITAHPPRLAAPCDLADWHHQAPSTGTTVFKQVGGLCAATFAGVVGAITSAFPPRQCLSSSAGSDPGK